MRQINARTDSISAVEKAQYAHAEAQGDIGPDSYSRNFRESIVPSSVARIARGKGPDFDMESLVQKYSGISSMQMDGETNQPYEDGLTNARNVESVVREARGLSAKYAKRYATLVGAVRDNSPYVEGMGSPLEDPSIAEGFEKKKANSVFYSGKNYVKMTSHANLRYASGRLADLDAMMTDAPGPNVPIRASQSSRLRRMINDGSVKLNHSDAYQQKSA
jgi:hypothetical protein